MAVVRIKERNEIPSKYKWRLEDIYQDDALWENDYEIIKDLIEKVKSFSGSITTEKDLLAALHTRDELMALECKVTCYAKMRNDEDTINEEYVKWVECGRKISTQSKAALTIIEAEFLKIADKILKFVDTCSELIPYRHYLQTILHCKEHIVSEKENDVVENLESSIEEFTSQHQNVLRKISFDKIKDSAGREHDLSPATLIDHLQSSDQKRREHAYIGIFSKYGNSSTEFAAAYNGYVKSYKELAKIRKYDSSLHAALYPHNFPVEIFNNLLAITKEYLPLRYRYKVVGVVKTKNQEPIRY